MNPLETLNATLVSEITKEQFVNLANSFLTAPSIIILFVSIFAILLVIGLIFVKRDRGKFLEIWAITLVLSLIVALFLIFLPNTVSNFTEWLRGLI